MIAVMSPVVVWVVVAYAHLIIGLIVYVICDPVLYKRKESCNLEILLWVIIWPITAVVAFALLLCRWLRPHLRLHS